MPFGDWNERRAWALVATVSATLVGVATHRALRQGWSALRHEPPPDDPARPDVRLRDALLWASAAGVVTGVGRVLARKGAAEGWRRVTGRTPPL